MATTNCPSINFSKIKYSCISALKNFSFGSCFNSRGGVKLKKTELSPEVASSPGDGSNSGAKDNNLDPTPTLLLPGNHLTTDTTNTSQNFTNYDAPVPINGEQNGVIDVVNIKSIPVAKSENKEMDPLVEVHMEEFNKFILSILSYASDKPKLLTPILLVDESPSHDDSEREATDPIFTIIDKNYFLAEGVVLNMPMPIPIEEEVLVEDLGGSKSRLVPKVLDYKVVQEYPESVIILPVDLYLSKEKSVPASPESPLSALSSPVPIQPSKGIRAVRIRVAPVDVRKKGDRIIEPDELCANATIDDKDLKNWSEIGASLAQPQSNALPQSSSIFEQFFTSIVTQKNPDNFFKTLNEYVESVKQSIEGVFPGPAPASAKVEPNNNIGR